MMFFIILAIVIVSYVKVFWASVKKGACMHTHFIAFPTCIRDLLLDCARAVM